MPMTSEQFQKALDSIEAQVKAEHQQIAEATRAPAPPALRRTSPLIHVSECREFWFTLLRYFTAYTKPNRKPRLLPPPEEINHQ